MSAPTHPDVEHDADNDITGKRENPALSQPEFVVATREELREQPLRDRVVKALEEDGRPETA
jgi:hypothetical protein